MIYVRHNGKTVCPPCRPERNARSAASMRRWRAGRSLAPLGTVGLVVGLLGCGSDFTARPLFAEHGAGGAAAAAVSVASVSSAASSSGGGGTAIPPGWQPAEVGGCAVPTVLHASPSSAGCSPCSCGPLVAPGDPNGDKPRCDAGGPTLLGWYGAACPTGADTSMPLKLGACAPLAQGFLAVVLAPSAVYNPVKLYCEPEPEGGLVEPAATFAVDVALCPVSGPQATCVERLGQHECPDGYPEGRSLYEAAVDGRACTACGCGKPSAGCTAPKVSTFASKDCSGGAQDLAQTCKVGTGSVKLVAAAELIGSCTPSAGGVASGKVAPVGLHSVCCRGTI